MNLSSQLAQLESEVSELNRLLVLFRSDPAQRRFYELLRLCRAVSSTAQTMECKLRQRMPEQNSQEQA